MKITANYQTITGTVKPMHGVGQPPFIGANFSLFHYLTEAGIPYARLHDVGGWMGQNLYVDIPNLFRDFDADENDPHNYDFAFTDRLLKALCDAGVEPFFRLGVTIENSWELKAYRLQPPKDPAKWARICEHIIRHYNEGWADGYHMGITYWEIWNEVDNCMEVGKSPMWHGTKEDYFRLYEVTARHLKKCFGDSIKVGGYAACGFYAWDCDPNCDGNLVHTENPGYWRKKWEFFVEYFHDFLKYITSPEHHTPIDFFSWHVYSDIHKCLDQAAYVRRVLNHYGLNDVPDILNEWNLCYDVKRRATPYAAAQSFAFLLGMQKQSVSEMNYYDARLGASPYGGMFNPSTWEPYLTYYAFLSFNSAYKLKKEVETDSDDGNVFTLGATDGTDKVLLMANIGKEQTADLELQGVDLAKATVIRIDETHTYSLTGESIKDGKLFLPANSCVEIRF